MKTWRRLLLFLRRRKLDRELQEEIRFHLEMKAEEQRAAGLDGREALRAAALSFGNTTVVREQSREFWGWTWLDRLGQDLRYALRTLLGAPGFTATVILILALATGANTAVFTMINAAILRTLPVPRPQELVGIEVQQQRGRRAIFSYPFYRDLRDENRALAGLAAQFSSDVSLSAGGAAEFLNAAPVTGNYFRVLGISPVLGRNLEDSDDRPEAPAVCVLGHAPWRKSFGSDPKVLGRTVRLNTRPFTVVGVLPASFPGVEPGMATALYVPLAKDAELSPPRRELLSNRRSSWLRLVGRLAPGAAPARARAGLQIALDRIAHEGRGRRDAGRVTLRPASQGFGFARQMLERPLLVLMAATAALLLIACANVSMLLLARARARHHEIAVRMALGAGRGRVIRQLLTESFLLAVAGGVAGLLIVRPLVRISVAFLPVYFRELDTSPDWMVFLFLAAGISTVTMLFGLAPAWMATRVDVTPALKTAGGSIGTRLRLGRWLATAQVALCLVLLIGAGLFAASLRNLRAVPPGFEPAGVVLLSLNPQLNGYSEAAQQALIDRLLQRVRPMTGVRAAGLAGIVPLSNAMQSRDFTPEGYPTDAETPTALLNPVTPGYFGTMRIPLLAGREFAARDGAGAPPVIIVNREFARRFWPGRNPVGRRITWGNPFDPKRSIEVVGVAGNQKYDNLREAQQTIAYLPLAQQSAGEVTLHVRTAGPPAAMIARLRATIRELDPNLPVFGVKTLEDQVDESIPVDRLMAWLAAGFASVALALAVAGLYGVTAYALARRTREIAVRLALGATPGSVLGLFLRESAVIIGVGVASGAPAAWAASRLAARMLYGVETLDPTLYAASALLLAGVEALAVYCAAHRAARLEPSIALRAE